MKKLLILIGPSAGGKTTFANSLESKDFKEIISITTRQPRAGEVDGESYFFWSETQFTNSIKQGRMIEHAEYCGNYYGNEVDVLCEQVDKNHKNGKHSVIILELQGAINLKKWIWENRESTQIVCSTAFCYVPPNEQRRRLVDRLLSDVDNQNPASARRHIETFFDRAKNSDAEYDWMKHPTVDILLCCDEGSESYNYQKIMNLLEK